jgi:peptide/nickel transport system ATP-binding protein
MLEIKNLTTRLKINSQLISVVEDLSLSLKKGKTLALVGESGSGKSMTALSILRILPTPPALPPEGEIIYKGNNILTLTSKQMGQLRGSRIAMIFQNPNTCLNPVQTIGSQLIEVIHTHLNLSFEEGIQKILTVLQEVGISKPEERLYDYPHQLSGGMKQRIMIAMALLCNPDILIADEPTTALDVTTQAQVLELIKAIQKKHGMSILLITHDMGVVAEMADDVVIMYAAQVIETAPAPTLFNSMLHPYTQGLFQSRPLLTTTRKKLTSIPGNVPPATDFPKGCRFHPRCAKAMPCCSKGTVPYFNKNHNTQSVKCWLYD